MTVKSIAYRVLTKGLLGWHAQPLRLRVARARFRRGGGRLRLHFFHRVDDPYSTALLRPLARLRAELPFDLGVDLVPPPPRSEDPEPARRNDYAVADLRRMSKFCDVWSPPQAQRPSDDAIYAAEAALAQIDDVDTFLDAAARLVEPLWRNDVQALRGQAQGDGATRERALAAGQQRLRRWGHAHGGTLYDGARWYWGVDRLPALASAVAAQTGHHPAALTLPWRDPQRWPHADAKAPVTLFFSFRSPYSYLALARADRLAQRTGRTLHLRPVLPMVMRGLAVPRAKRLRILADAGWEARRLGIPFGPICDPLGRGVEWLLAATTVAERHGCAMAFARAGTTWTWARARDFTDQRVRRRLCAAFALPWAEVCDAVATECWRETVEANRQALTAAGLWGVPSFVVGPHALWGQDRLPLLAALLRDPQLLAEAGTSWQHT